MASARADLEDLADVSVWSMTRQETAATFVELTRLQAQVAELELRVARHAETVEVGLDQGATSTAQLVVPHREGDPRRGAPALAARRSAG